MVLINFFFFSFKSIQYINHKISSIFLLSSLFLVSFQLYCLLFIIKSLFVKMKNILRLTTSFSTKNKIPRPRDPTMPESFETKLSDKEMKILLDPRGFMT